MRAFFVLLVLAGCAQTPAQMQAQTEAQAAQAVIDDFVAKVRAFTVEDLQTATALANAAGDINDAACWTFLSSLIPTMQSPKVGAATAIEIARIAQSPVFVEKCKQNGGVFTTLPIPSNLPPAAAAVLTRLPI